MKKIICLLLLFSLLIGALSACTGPNEEESTAGITTDETAGKDESTSNTQTSTEVPPENQTETNTGSSGESTEESDNSETNETTEKETEAPLPSIDDMNNNAYGEAYYILEGYGMNQRANGWNVDDRFNIDTVILRGEICKF